MVASEIAGDRGIESTDYYICMLSQWQPRRRLVANERSPNYELIKFSEVILKLFQVVVRSFGLQRHQIDFLWIKFSKYFYIFIIFIYFMYNLSVTFLKD